MSGGGLRKKGNYHSTCFFFERRGFYWMIFWRVLGELAGGEFEFCSREGSVQGAPVCRGFWAWGPVYPYGILELGSFPIW
jgi:hypothetical protein